MTYNFDPERWHEDQVRLVEHRLKTGALDEEAARRELEEIERRYEAMLDRLDATYRLGK